MANNGKVKVLATTAIIDDLVDQIGGEFIDHISLITGELDPHSYELVKGDDEKLSFAQIVFYNELGLEHGASLHYSLDHHPHAIALGNSVIHDHPEKILKIDREVDPHIWMDISLWINAIDPIVEALSVADREHALVFQKNGEIVREKMRLMDEKIQRLMQQISEEKRYLVTSHDAFNYFTRRYLANKNEEDWNKRCAAPEGLSPEGQLSTAHIIRIVHHLALYKIKVIFLESNVSRDSIKKVAMVCKEKGMEVALSKEVLYGDTLGAKGSGAETYLQMMEYNAELLFKEWQ